MVTSIAFTAPKGSCENQFAAPPEAYQNLINELDKIATAAILEAQHNPDQVEFLRKRLMGKRKELHDAIKILKENNTSGSDLYRKGISMLSEMNEAVSDARREFRAFSIEGNAAKASYQERSERIRSRTLGLSLAPQEALPAATLQFVNAGRIPREATAQKNIRFTTNPEALRRCIVATRQGGQLSGKLCTEAAKVLASWNAGKSWTEPELRKEAHHIVWISINGPIQEGTPDPDTVSALTDALLLCRQLWINPLDNYDNY
jgi:hypothetical protein